MKDDLISRQAAIKALEKAGEVNYLATGEFHGIINALNVIKGLPIAEPSGELIRCGECKWWDDKGNGIGYCHAAKHGYYSEHWEIHINRTYKKDFYCADAERRTDE